MPTDRYRKVMALRRVRTSIGAVDRGTAMAIERERDIYRQKYKHLGRNREESRGTAMGIGRNREIQV